MVYVAERICGICSFGHGYGYVKTIEHIMGIEPTDRARYIRTLLFELSRMHSHILWLGLMADAFGFESLFMETWKLREKILDMLEAATGGRVIFSIIRIGGLRKDVPDDILKGFLPELEKVVEGIKACEKVFLSDPAVLSRLKGIGYLSKEDAVNLGCEGPFLRASGVAWDNRMRGYAAYPSVDFEIITSDEGDSYARCYVRIQEIYQSADIIRQCIEKMPQEGIYVPIKGFPNGDNRAAAGRSLLLCPCFGQEIYREDEGQDTNLCQYTCSCQDLKGVRHSGRAHIGGNHRSLYFLY